MPVVLGLEVGGRIDAEAVRFMRRLAASKARGTPARLRKAALQASVHRWTEMLALAAQRAYALSLLELPLDAADECEGHGTALGGCVGGCPGRGAWLPACAGAGAPTAGQR